MKKFLMAAMAVATIVMVGCKPENKAEYLSNLDGYWVYENATATPAKVALEVTGNAVVLTVDATTEAGTLAYEASTGKGTVTCADPAHKETIEVASIDGDKKNINLTIKEDGTVKFEGKLAKSQKSEQPQGDMPEVAATEGAVTIVWNTVDFTPCAENQLVFAGDYNAYNTDPAAMVHFEAIEGYDGWWKAVITPADASASPVLAGKPCALYMDGTFPSSWDHQWINVDDDHQCTILAGEATLEVEYEVESKLVVANNSSVIYVRSYGFKTDPCQEPEKYEVTFTVTAPAMNDTCIVYAVGAFNSWTANATPMTKGADGKWTVTVKDVVMKAEYKYVVNGSWDYEELVEAEDGAECAKGLSGNRSVNDVDMQDVVANFKGITIEKCEDAPQE